MALRSPYKHLDKAKSIIHGGSEVVNSTYSSPSASENNNEADAAVRLRNPQERRHALGHKPTRFSLKPNINKPSVNLELNLNIYQMQDPVEFFSAYEKLEYAKEEIQRQTGGSITKKIEYNPSANPWRRQQGILGKSVSYKQHHSSVVSENDDTCVSSQETLRQDNPSLSEVENSVNKILDELLSGCIENLDGDEALSVLQDCLQIKPIEDYLPKFSCTGRADLLDLGEELPKNRKSLPDIQNLMRGISVKTPVNRKHVVDNSVRTLPSPTLPKNLFAALSSLNKHISQSKPINDPFLHLDVDISEQLRVRKELSISDKLQSLEVEATSSAAVGMDLKDVIERERPNLVDKSVNIHSKSIDINSRSLGTNVELVDRNGNNDMISRARLYADTRLCTNRANRIGKNAQDIMPEAISSPQPHTNVEESYYYCFFGTWSE